MFFFFFKQKTAYEMRISDWSSDVCSSDLMGGSFAYHRELELFQRAGYTAPEVLRLATLGMAEYLGQDEDLGSIEDGKLADFFLVTADPTKDLKALKAISMVVANGTVYFPSEIYQIGRASCRERVCQYV